MGGCQRLDVDPPATTAGRLCLEVCEEGATDALAMRLGSHGHEMDFKRAGIVRSESGGTDDVGPATGEPGRQAVEVSKIRGIRLWQAEPIRKDRDQLLALIGKVRFEGNELEIRRLGSSSS